MIVSLSALLFSVERGSTTVGTILFSSPLAPYIFFVVLLSVFFFSSLLDFVSLITAVCFVSFYSFLPTISTSLSCSRTACLFLSHSFPFRNVINLFMIITETYRTVHFNHLIQNENWSNRILSLIAFQILLLLFPFLCCYTIFFIWNRNGKFRQLFPQLIVCVCVCVVSVVSCIECPKIFKYRLLQVYGGEKRFFFSKVHPLNVEKWLWIKNELWGENFYNARKNSRLHIIALSWI